MCSILFNDDMMLSMGSKNLLNNFDQPNWPTLIHNCMYRIEYLVIKTRGWIIQSTCGNPLVITLTFSGVRTCYKLHINMVIGRWSLTKNKNMKFVVRNI